MLSNRNHIFAATLVIACLALIPIWSVSHPPLTDYPNHLARMHILMMDGTNETLNKYYQIRWAALPNLAMDITVPVLGRFIGIEAAGKVFLSATLILILTGTIALHYAVHRKWSAWPLLSALLLYNPFFLWGFVNFLFGLGVAFWLAALWIAFRDKQSAWVLFPPAALGLFFLHLMPFGIYLVVIAAYEAGLALRDGFNLRQVGKRGTQIALQALPAAILFLAASPTSSGQSGTLFSEVPNKVAAFRYLFANYDPLLDFKLTFLPLLAALVLGIATRRVTVDRRMLVPLGMMSLIYFAIPSSLLSGGSAWRRFMVPLTMLAIASTTWDVRKPRLNALLATLIGIIFIARMWVLEQAWIKQDRELASIRALISSVPDGAKLFPLFMTPRHSKSTVTYRSHFPSMAVVDRNAFVPSLFAYEHQQPLQFSEQVRTQMHGDMRPKMFLSQGATPDWTLIATEYDYVVVTNSHYLEGNIQSTFKKIATAEDVALYEVAGRTK